MSLYYKHSTPAVYLQAPRSFGRGVLFYLTIDIMTKRAAFFVDGLNLYHSIDDLNQPHLKWLDLTALARTVIPKRDEHVEYVVYFSAYPTHLENSFPEKLSRHRLYVKALLSCGVQFVKGNFKHKYIRCKADCRKTFSTHEEKQTDVSIAVRILEDAFKDLYDVAYIVSADTDFVPALKRVKINFSEKELVAVFPPNRQRYAKILKQQTDRHIGLTANLFTKCLLPKHVTSADGTILDRPSVYDPRSD